MCSTWVSFDPGWPFHPNLIFLEKGGVYFSAAQYAHIRQAVKRQEQTSQLTSPDHLWGRKKCSNIDNGLNWPQLWHKIGIIQDLKVRLHVRFRGAILQCDFALYERFSHWILCILVILRKNSMSGMQTHLKLLTERVNTIEHFSRNRHCTTLRRKLDAIDQGILKGEVSLYYWPPVWLVWNQLYDNWHLFSYMTTDNFCFICKTD
jgi:hypothetical protein